MGRRGRGRDAFLTLGEGWVSNVYYGDLYIFAYCTVFVCLYEYSDKRMYVPLRVYIRPRMQVFLYARLYICLRVTHFISNNRTSRKSLLENRPLRTGKRVSLAVFLLARSWSCFCESPKALLAAPAIRVSGRGTGTCRSRSLYIRKYTGPCWGFIGALIGVTPSI